MSVTIRPATLADKDAMADVHDKAMMPFLEFYSALWTKTPSEVLPVLTEKAMNNPKFVFLVAEVEGSVVGFTRYTIIPAQKPADVTNEKVEQDSTAKKEPEEEKPPHVLLIQPKEQLKEIWVRFNARDAEMDACKEKAVKGQRHYYVLHLMIHPDYQRRGIGGKLLQTVIDRADTEGVPTILTSSESAHELYLKLGFEDLGVWTIDNEAWAKEIVEVNASVGIKENEDLARNYAGIKEVEACMIRSPRQG
ncbi:acyl-CoA N-acyltransferase [Dactylonectria estremocensis]|uniref:Acyl-CoA N-acyltransferase n=1 Tax=Dactylonectria estremocensis TaxID=1079267 RepID=A0A9P9IIX1_9HYPO|nr:acyl-CoA N-acyltransferase [Dactylonectria estremocensis]